MTSPSKTTLGQWIRKGRKSVGWSQEDLARYLDVPEATVAQWESDEVVPSEDEAERIGNLIAAAMEQNELALEREEEEAADPSAAAWVEL